MLPSRVVGRDRLGDLAEVARPTPIDEWHRHLEAVLRRQARRELYSGGVS
jgi:hypothetical protein